MFRLTKQVFNALLSFSRSLAGMVNVSDHTKCITLIKQRCMSRATLIILMNTIKDCVTIHLRLI